ncbi:hypothetical protein [Terrihabitans rhizophilus]|jgi:hypothetical protein|uniref:DUF1292 domain-containing protein n=1 Tax=Terrihabitans rhizophilus TaxID=3092662 RepID=A0ABU4RP27_9HYPH|nr:hypothetical protein [Terrihabitans sp. PJ23]MDX6805938.1 hypothetical protein [Terrihabitans sp. PJ23]
MAKFAGLRIIEDDDEGFIFMFETDDGKTLRFSASPEDVDTIVDAIDELYEDEDDAAVGDETEPDDTNN